ncbi:MAG: carboxylating nicotinate-nucleotide diphosphorylase [candidate division WOR-3 bacterium]|nr:carboxylating nicotinate-nucleotide diphosphorylase [candidate division WOR-3 bacterium]
MKTEISKLNLKQIIQQALKEDIGSGDITTNFTVDKNKIVTAEIIAKDDGILAGSDVVKMVFQYLDPKVNVNFKIKDGERFKSKQVIAQITGKAQALLSGERTALNFLCRLSGIASLTRKFVDKISDTKAKILDTRKTTPLLRDLEKYAVRVGGGYNHRMGLYDMMLVKDNHIKIAGGITQAIKKAQKYNKNKLPIEVETKNLNEVKQALALNVSIIMLDNMNLRQIAQAVKLVKGKAKLEVSGGVNLKNVRKIAKTGVDYISVGAITHSAPIVDMSMKIK